METKTSSTFRQEGNQLIYTRVLNAPRELVWEVWTEPQHIKEWWGPNGFTLTHKSMQVQPTKLWEFIMHGQDRDYDNRIEYIDVEKPHLLSYNQSNGAGTLRFTV